MSGISRLAAVAVTLLLASPVRAHAPLETWIDVTVQADTIQLHVIMAPVAALRLIDPAAPVRRLTAEDFAQQRPRLMQEGAALFTLVQLKNRLAARQVEVVLTEEGDVAYQIIYPRPAPGLLMIDATFLKRLGDGFGGMMDVRDTQGHRLGWDQLTHDNATLIVMLPTPGLPPKKN